MIMKGLIHLLGDNNIISLIIKLIPIAILAYVVVDYPEFGTVWYGKAIYLLLLAYIGLQSIINDVYDMIKKN